MVPFSILSAFYHISGKQSCAQSSAELRLFTDDQFGTQFFFQGFHKTLVFGYASGHHIRFFSFDTLGQGGCLGGNGFVQAVYNVVRVFILGN